MSDSSAFALMMAQEGFLKITMGGRPFRWSTLLDGLVGENLTWEAGADALCYFLDRVPIYDRNLIAHSHGGNVALMALASGLQVNTLTTVGTPRRHDVDYLTASRRVSFWQHIYDRKIDWIAWLGMWGDRSVDLDRGFHDVPGCLNLPIDGISHSKVLRDASSLHYWHDNGWLSNIRAAGAPLGAA